MQSTDRPVTNEWLIEYAKRQSEVDAFNIFISRDKSQRRHFFWGQRHVRLGGNHLPPQDYEDCTTFLKACNIRFSNVIPTENGPGTIENDTIVVARDHFETGYNKNIRYYAAMHDAAQKVDPSLQAAQNNSKLRSLAISQAAALTASSAVVVPSVLGLTGDFTSMHAMMLTGAIFAVSTAVCIYMNNKNLKSGIAIFVLETGVTAGVSYVSFTYIAPAMVDSGLSLPAADVILCADIIGLLLLVNFGTQLLINRQATNTAEVVRV